MSRRLSPIDIQHAEFTRSALGYDRKEVRAFLERLAAEVEAGLRESQALRQELEAAEARMAELKAAESELQRAVMAAERVATDMKEVARREAQLLLQDAEQRKQATLRAAQRTLQETQAAVSRLELQRTLFKEQFRGLLQAYLTGLDADPPTEPPRSDEAAAEDDLAARALLDDSVEP
ncbi:MAG: DivIVA domain-containing protein [Trueperaceae bacterium]